MFEGITDDDPGTEWLLSWPGVWWPGPQMWSPHTHWQCGHHWLGVRGRIHCQGGSLPETSWHGGLAWESWMVLLQTGHCQHSPPELLWRSQDHPCWGVLCRGEYTYTVKNCQRWPLPQRCQAKFRSAVPRWDSEHTRSAFSREDSEFSFHSYVKSFLAFSEGIQESQ